MKKYLLPALLASMVASPLYAQIEDDIYYNPKKSTTQTKTSKKQSNYIADFQDMDVDAYNRRGQYYSSPVDTIGADAEAAQDFVYTTQIQKYYNPTIVLDNEALLADVLANSYGNVNVEFNINGLPYFGPYYSWTPSAWNRLWWNISPGWSISWAWSNPWWGPSWGPAWDWGPSWGWGWNSWWGPSYGWGGWGPSWGPYPSYGWGPYYWGPGFGGYYGGHYADYRPGGNRPVGAHPGWNANTRPGGNYNGGHAYGNNRNQYGRPAYGNTNSARPGSAQANPGYTIGSNGHRYTGTSSANDRHNSNASQSPSGNRNTGTVNTGGHRQSGQGAYQSTGTNRNSSTTTNRTTTTRRESTTTTNRRTTTRNESDYNTRRSTSNSSSGSYNRSSGGFGGGSMGGGHRTTGGGGGGGSSRGGHR